MIGISAAYCLQSTQPDSTSLFTTQPDNLFAHVLYRIFFAMRVLTLHIKELEQNVAGEKPVRARGFAPYVQLLSLIHI